MPVQHAQDIDIPDDVDPNGPLPEAQVTVTVTIDGAIELAGEFIGMLACPSGLLCVGDAEDERVVEVPAGALRVAVTRDPVQFATQVTIHISPA